MEITVTSLNKCTNDTSDQQLFHSILPRKGSTNHLLTYPKEHAATAVAMITGLIPFVLHHYGNKTRKWFSLRALDGSSGSRWDKQTGAVITPNDKVVQDGLSSKYWWLADALQDVEDQEPTEPARPVGRAMPTPQDAALPPDRKSPFPKIWKPPTDTITKRKTTTPALCPVNLC